MTSKAIKAAQKLSRKERLKQSKVIALLFRSGLTLAKYPLKMFYLLSEEEDPDAHPVQFTVTVPSKNFKKAVDRNLLKRRIREAYRRNKSFLLQSLQDHQKKIQCIFLYTAQEVMDYPSIEKAMQTLLHRLKDRLD